jgi:hypothetical protein
MTATLWLNASCKRVVRSRVIPNANAYAIMSKVNEVQLSVLKDADQELTFVPLKPRRSFSQRTL